MADIHDDFEQAARAVLGGDYDRLTDRTLDHEFDAFAEYDKEQAAADAEDANDDWLCPYCNEWASSSAEHYAAFHPELA